MRLPDIIRYGIWAGIVATANANRRHYGMTTTWLPHLLANTCTLLLPDIYGRLAPRERECAVDMLRTAPRTQPARGTEWRVIHDTLHAIVCDNPGYVVYMAPLAAGYLLSHPQFNIYKGTLAEKRLAGFGLDALPHAATAFALVAFVGDGVHEAVRHAAHESRLARPLRWGDAHQALLSAAVLTLATIIWEFGEYKIHLSELAQRSDTSEINMQWSPQDTVYDCVANVIGWGLAVAWRTRRFSAPL